MSDLLDYVKRWLSYDAEKEFYYKHFPSLLETAQLIIRPMRRDDLKEVSAIEQAAYEFPWEPATFRDCYKIGYFCWVGEKAGRVVCYGICTVGAGESHVLNLCVSPEFQGRGFGRSMLARLMEEAKKFKADSMFLEVRPTNENAQSLYRQMGFNEIGMRKDYYPARNGREDAIVMACSL